MEKEHQPDSMATITMKPEYPPSEVYSTSEPPPAYRQRSSNAVQIARIVGLTVVASTFILGAFILASSWVSARASCHQLEQLDAMLDKELALEGRVYGNDGLIADEPLPSAHALQGLAPPHAPAPAPAPAQLSTAPPPPHKEDALKQAETKIDEDILQKIDDENSKSETSNTSDESSDSDSSAEDEDELDAIRPILKLPVQFDLDELAGAFLANNQKGRMNCMVERRRDDPERRFPFNILGAFAPRSAHAERIAIICRGGDQAEHRPIGFPEPQSQVFAFPLSGPVRLPLRPQPERAPPAPPAHAHPAAPRMPPFAPLAHHSRPGPFPLPMPWDSSEEQMGGPREMRIHVQRVIAIPSGQAPPNMLPPAETMGNAGPFSPPPPPPQPRDQNDQPTIIHQFVPQSAPTQEVEQPEIQKVQMDSTPIQMGFPWGLLPSEMHVIHRAAAEDQQQRQMRDRDQQIDNDMQEVKTIVNTLAAAAEAEAEAEAQAQAEAHAQAQAEADQQRQHNAQAQESAPQPPRAPRTLLLPQEVPMMDERPHYMQPRSVRSLDAPLQR